MGHTVELRQRGCSLVPTSQLRYIYNNFVEINKPVDSAPHKWISNTFYGASRSNLYMCSTNHGSSNIIINQLIKTKLSRETVKYELVWRELPKMTEIFDVYVDSFTLAHLPTWRWQDSWPIPLPATRERLSCFGFTYYNSFCISFLFISFFISCF